MRVSSPSEVSGTGSTYSVANRFPTPIHARFTVTGLP
jgi:hypothetical protein